MNNINYITNQCCKFWKRLSKLIFLRSLSNIAIYVMNFITITHNARQCVMWARKVATFILKRTHNTPSTRTSRVTRRVQSKSHGLELPLIPVEPGSNVSCYDVPECTCLLSSGASPDTWQFSIPQFVRHGLLDFLMWHLTEELTPLELPSPNSIWLFYYF